MGEREKPSPPDHTALVRELRSMAESYEKNVLSMFDGIQPTDDFDRRVMNRAVANAKRDAATCRNAADALERAQGGDATNGDHGLRQVVPTVTPERRGEDAGGVTKEKSACGSTLSTPDVPEPSEEAIEAAAIKLDPFHSICDGEAMKQRTRAEVREILRVAYAIDARGEGT